MFDRLKNLFKPKPPIELDIDEVPEFISNEFTAEQGTIKNKISSVVDDIINEVSKSGIVIV